MFIAKSHLANTSRKLCESRGFSDLCVVDLNTHRLSILFPFYTPIGNLSYQSAVDVYISMSVLCANLLSSFHARNAYPNHTHTHIYTKHEHTLVVVVGRSKAEKASSLVVLAAPPTSIPKHSHKPRSVHQIIPLYCGSPAPNHPLSHSPFRRSSTTVVVSHAIWFADNNNNHIDEGLIRLQPFPVHNHHPI